MEKLEKRLANLDRIEMKIKQNLEYKKKIQETQMLGQIVKLNQVEKNNLDEKIHVIRKFINKLDYLIESKPLVSSLDKNLLDYTDYETFYNKTK